MFDFLKDQDLLITGGTGSFGQVFAKRVLEADLCRRVIIFSRDEWKQWEMRQKDPIFNHPKIRYFLGDVRDMSRLHRAFHEVDYVIHAAALKQVPAAEYNPTEFVKTNVLGAMNVIDAAIDCGVKKVIGLSTDKAVNPINLYGASKLCAEKLLIAGNSYVGSAHNPSFSVVRYGNVLASRGSILPVWQDLIAKGAMELPITDVRMTRFWITLDKAVDFVLQCLSLSQGGEIYVPKVPSMKVADLAKAIAPKLSLKEIGIREGEKLHELLINIEDARHTFEYHNHYLIVPEILTHNAEGLAHFMRNRPGKNVPEQFSYTSQNNSEWLDAMEIQRHLALKVSS